MSGSQPGTAPRHRPGRVISNNTWAWVVQILSVGVAVALVVHGILDSGLPTADWTYPIELGVGTLLIMLVLVSWFLRLQAKAVARLHPGASVVTAIANVQFSAQLRAMTQTLAIPAGRTYSGSYYAVAFDSDAVWIVLGSIWPKDIVRIPRDVCSGLRAVRVQQGVFNQNCVELQIALGSESTIIDLLLLRPLPLAAVPFGKDRLAAKAAELRLALGLESTTGPDTRSGRTVRE